MDQKFKLDKLFRAFVEHVLPDGEVVIVRALSDVEQAIRQRDALAASALAEAACKKPGTVEHSSVILPLENADDKDRRETLKHYLSIQSVRDAAREIEPVFIPIPDGATPEEERAVLLKREDQKADIDTRRIARVQAAFEKNNKLVDDASPEYVLERVRRMAILFFADTIFQEEFVTWTLCHCVEKSGKPRFSREEVIGLHEKVRSALLTVVGEVNDYDPLK